MKPEVKSAKRASSVIKRTRMRRDAAPGILPRCLIRRETGRHGAAEMWRREYAMMTRRVRDDDARRDSC